MVKLRVLYFTLERSCISDAILRLSTSQKLRRETSYGRLPEESTQSSSLDQWFLTFLVMLFFEGVVKLQTYLPEEGTRASSCVF